MSRIQIEQAGAVGRPAGTAGPSVLVVTSNWWQLSLRIAMALADSGCTVSFVCPPGHPSRFVSRITRTFCLGSLSPVADLVRAIRQVNPHLLVPCDDRVVSMLHLIHRNFPDLRALIELSLGRPSAYATMSGRGALQQLAAKLGLRVPLHYSLQSEEHAARCFGELSPVAVVKVDGSYGGEGVRIVRSADEAARTYRRLSRRVGLATGFKRYLINHDPLWLWLRQQAGTAPEITMQAYVDGTPANTMAASWGGKVLGHVSVSTLTSMGATGATMVAQILVNDDMSRSAVLLARELGICGFFGLDFVVERATGVPYLIELNPRCTQLGHLKLAGQGSLADLLASGFRGIGASIPEAKGLRAGDVVALFPVVQPGSMDGRYPQPVWYDVPVQEPALVQELLRKPWPERQWLARAYHWFKTPTLTSPVEYLPACGDLGRRRTSVL